MSVTALASGTLCTSPGVQIKTWGEDEAVAYSAASAKTHVISEAAAQILRLAAEPGVDEAALQRFFFPEEAIDATSVDADRVLLRELVEGLLSVGLLTRRD